MDWWQRFWKKATSPAVSLQARLGEPSPIGTPQSDMAKVLVVEDNPANMTLATFLLENAGHTVLKALDAEAGVALAGTEQPRLILMGIQLPRRDGLKTTAVLKADPAAREIPPIAL